MWLESEEKRLKKVILHVISHEIKPISLFLLNKKVIKLFQNSSFLKKNFYQIVNKLILSGNIKQLKKTKSLVKGYINGEINFQKLYEGKMKIISSLSGFVSSNDGSEYFVHRSNLNGALNGDIVKFYTMRNSDDQNRIDAYICEVISHEKKFYSCLFEIDSNNNYICLPDDKKMYYKMILDDHHGLANNQKILVKINRFNNNIAYCSVSRIIGHKNDVGVDILSVVLDSGISPEFSDVVLAKSREISININEKQIKLRKDLTHLNFVTIDPEESKDFDDSICVQKIDNDKFKLYVSIADVCNFIKFNDEIDKSARERGTSIYLADRVIPMLPHILSDDICSLIPNKKRFTTTCEMTINHLGKIVDIKVYPSIIINKRRFSYDEVNHFFDDYSYLKDDESIKEMLRNAYELHKILDAVKMQRGYINFNVPEAEVILDKNGFPIDVRLRHLGNAQNLIENFMLAANESITIFACKNKIPFIYRVHEKPDVTKIHLLLSEAKSLKFKINTDLKNIHAKDISFWLKDNISNKHLSLINLLLLRCMSKAKYSINNLGHFGLALKNYTHYTSPIRRYPDLLVNRILWMFLFDKNSYTDDERQQLISHLNEFCQISSNKEIISIECERKVKSMKFAEFMSTKIGNVFKGFVSSVSPYGAFVQLSNTIEGLICMSNFKNDFYVFNSELNQLIGSKTSQVIRIGTWVKVKCISANKELRKIDFELIENLGI